VGDTVPSFIGYSKRDLMPFLLLDDFHIEMRGDGWVRRQTPSAGSPITPAMTITLELE
jgi:hypothetical protein